jgi:hypothetical protein
MGASRSEIRVGEGVREKLSSAQMIHADECSKSQLRAAMRGKLEN